MILLTNHSNGKFEYFVYLFKTKIIFMKLSNVIMFLSEELHQLSYSRILRIHLENYATLWFPFYCFKNHSCRIDFFISLQTTYWSEDGLLKEHWIFKLGKNNFEFLPLAAIRLFFYWINYS